MFILFRLIFVAVLIVIAIWYMVYKIIHRNDKRIKVGQTYTCDQIDFVYDAQERTKYTVVFIDRNVVKVRISTTLGKHKTRTIPRSAFESSFHRSVG